MDEAPGLAGLDIPEQLIIEHMDPFYAECRAYGRIKEEERGGEVALRCHGFTSIPADREDEMSVAFSVYDWQRPPGDYERPPAQRQPFRAIVKDLALTQVCFTKAMVRKMRADLFTLRDMHVFVRDIRRNNYLGGSWWTLVSRGQRHI